MKYPNLLYTAVLATVLVVPFMIGWLAPTLEPYPAVLLPSGAGKLRTAGDRVDCYRIEIFGKAPGQDHWIRLSPPQFLRPIPTQYFQALAQRYFGLIPSLRAVHPIRWFGVVTTAAHNATPAEIQDAKQWLQARLRENRCDDGVLRVTQEIVTFRRSDGAEVATPYKNDKDFRLR